MTQEKSIWRNYHKLGYPSNLDVTSCRELEKEADCLYEDADYLSEDQQNRLCAIEDYIEGNCYNVLIKQLLNGTLTEREIEVNQFFYHYPDKSEKKFYEDVYGIDFHKHHLQQEEYDRVQKLPHIYEDGKKWSSHYLASKRWELGYDPFKPYKIQYDGNYTEYSDYEEAILEFKKAFNCIRINGFNSGSVKELYFKGEKVLEKKLGFQIICSDRWVSRRYDFESEDMLLAYFETIPKNAMLNFRLSDF